ncbi:hypothetical protein C8J57DRAFT_1250620 [Mycena rebaudengoi]|nr:hypothetical protein C8J57DRAFT_1250620 [Mycena rebaudengoi]
MSSHPPPRSTLTPQSTTHPRADLSAMEGNRTLHRRSMVLHRSKLPIRFHRPAARRSRIWGHSERRGASVSPGAVVTHERLRSHHRQLSSQILPAILPFATQSHRPLTLRSHHKQLSSQILPAILPFATQSHRLELRLRPLDYHSLFATSSDFLSVQQLIRRLPECGDYRKRWLWYKALEFWQYAAYFEEQLENGGQHLQI